jgi:hypothetical protein
MIETLKSAISRRPFEPFRVVTSSGESYEIRHPEAALLLKGGLYIGLPQGNDKLPERVVYCSMLHITAVETLAPA